MVLFCNLPYRVSTTCHPQSPAHNKKKLLHMKKAVTRTQNQKKNSHRCMMIWMLELHDFTKTPGNMFKNLEEKD